MKKPTIRHFLTARDSADRLAKKPGPIAGPRKDTGLSSVFLDPSITFQSVEGFGGAFTESSAYVLRKMSKKNQKRIIDAYFGKGGHGYSLCRSHINSCDFSLGNWACDETKGDTQLKKFSLTRDKKYILPMIKEAQKASAKPFKLFASPWSPPAWMKTTGQMNHGGKLKKEYRQTWAEYYVRYIKEYKKQGVDIWGLTVQNEPAAVQTWDSCIYSAQEEKDFVRDHLGPTLERAGLGHVKIIIWDHNRDLLVQRAHAAYSDPEASKYIWGTGFHWYVDDKFDNVQLHHDAWPDKKLLFTEGCQEAGPHTGEWTLGERYGRSMISDLNKWTVGWVDWNLILDETGGPNHVGNLCSAPILADTVNDEVLFQSSYYYIGHFARFIRPNAKRILCATSKDALEATAFINPDGSVAVVVMNRSEVPVKFCLDHPKWTGGMTVSPQRSISTYVITA